MKVGLVALHFPRREHRDEMISRVRQAADVMMAAPGCLAADCWVSEDGQAVVTTGQWESEQAMTAGFAAVQAAGVDFGYDERESRPRQVFRLVCA
jgi:quinol monooxygenase YgiN